MSLSDTHEPEATRRLVVPLATLHTLLHWWYHLTTPPVPGLDASRQERESARQAHLTSTIILLSLFVLLAVLLGSIWIWDGVLLVVVLIALLIQGSALLLNRRGRVTLAGLLVVLWFEVGVTAFLFTIPGGLGVATLPAFYLFVEPELLAVSLLPAWSVFPVLLGNSLLMGIALLVLPRSAELDRLLTTTGYEVLGQPILLQLIVAVIAYLWVRGALHALARADRAEEIARLHQMLARQREEQLQAIEAQQKMTLAYEQQRSVNALKDQFLMHVAHELRTPLTVMGGYLDLLLQHKDSSLPEMHVQMLARLAESHEDLVLLVNRVLETVTMTRELPSLHPEPLILEPLVQQVLAHLDPRESQTYILEVQIDAHLAVWADAHALQQMLHHLLSNACKYSPKATIIHIEAAHTDADPASPVCMRVRDHGPGIPPEEQPLLFEPFVRLRRDLAGPVRGTGLGLALCKRLVEAMGGRIWVESSGRAGEGSCFSFTLPSGPSVSP